MILEKFIHRLEAHVFRFGSPLWDDGPAEGLRDQAYRLAEALKAQRASLTAAQSEALGLRDGLARQEKRANLLAAQVRICLRSDDTANAWKLALDLDRVRQTLHDDRPRLRQFLLTCRERQAHVEHLEQRLAEVQEALSRVG